MKVIGLIFTSFILFVLLTVFSAAFTVDRTALNPGFVSGFIDDIDFSQIYSETVADANRQTPVSAEEQKLSDAIINTIDSVEPVIKDSLAIAIDDAYAYLKGKADAPDLRKTLGDSIMNPGFTEKLLAQIDLSDLVNDFMSGQQTGGDAFDQAFSDSLVGTLDKMEPTIKSGSVAISGPMYDYLLRKSNTLDLRTEMRRRVVTRAFITNVVTAIDIKDLAQSLYGNEASFELPQGVTLASTEQDQVLALLEPAFKQGLIDAADPMADWLLGIRPSFSATISIQSALPGAKPIVKQAFLRQLPPELAAATPEQKDQVFELFWDEASASIASSFTLDSTSLGSDIPDMLADTLSSAESGLTDARTSIDEAADDFEQALREVRPYIRMFQTGYLLLILAILVFAGLIVLLYRSVKGASLHLGIFSLAYGVTNLIGVLIVRGTVGSERFLRNMLEDQAQETPQYMIDLMTRVVQAMTQPLFLLAIVGTVLGVGLLVLGIVYPRLKRKPAEAQPASQV